MNSSACVATVLLFGGLTAVAPNTAAAKELAGHELIVQLDSRAVVVDSPLESFTEGGLGLLRFDDEHEGLQLVDCNN